MKPDMGKITTCLSKFKTGLLLFTLISLILFQWGDFLFASPAKQQKNKPGLVPAPLLKFQEKGSPYAILVDKAIQKIFLYHRDRPFTPIRVYKCSTGENGGPKTKKNDRKTPEGIYFFTNSFVKKELSPIYGIRALPIDYPNPLDRKEGRGGYGIWFHGSNKPLKPNDTNGCIVLDNPSIDELASYIKLNDTPTIISSNIEMVDSKKREKETKKLGQIIENWRKAWEAEKIDEYMSFYNPRFTSQGMNWKQWRKYKARLAKQYKQIRVEVHNLRLLRANGVVLAKFTQRYRAPGFESWGEKRLYLQQNSNQWKISGEFFKESAKKRIAPEKPRLSSLKEIRQFITFWREAWEKKDLNTYISCYDPTFRSRGMNLKAWKNHRERLNGRYGSLKIEFHGLKIVQDSPQRARVSFKQSYRANGYQDYGLKKIFLIKKGKNWLIKTEKWRPLRRRSRL